MNQPDLITVPETPLPSLEVARRKLAAIELAAKVYLKIDVERTCGSEVYIRVLSGTTPEDVPQHVIDSAARRLGSCDWDYPEYYKRNGREVDASEAEYYEVEDATGLDATRSDVARLEREALKL